MSGPLPEIVWDVFVAERGEDGLVRLSAEPVGRVVAAGSPTAIRLAWERWPEHAKPSEEWPNARLSVRPAKVKP